MPIATAIALAIAAALFYGTGMEWGLWLIPVGIVVDLGIGFMVADEYEHRTRQRGP